MMKFNFLASIFCIISILFVFTGCNSSKENVDTTSNNILIDGIMDNDFIPPELSNRTEWNIELSFVEYNDNGIVINIKDYDNIGFAFNNLYFVLEIYEDGEWINLSNLNENSAYKNYGYALPNDTRDHISVNSICPAIALPDTGLKTGHYRATKVLSGRPFSVEFDLVID